MIDLEQEVKIKWFTRNKQKYIDLGYTFTNFSDEFYVKVKDLETNSNVKVEVFCDDCGVKLITPYRNYNKIINKSGKYRCRKCNAPFVSNIRINNNAEDAIEFFNEKMKEFGYESLATIDDYLGGDSPLPFICPKHGKQYVSTNQLHEHRGCYYCGISNRNNNRKISSEDIAKIISTKNNDELLNPEDYVDRFEKNLKVRCGSCGKIFITNFASISVSSGYCHECGFKASGNSSRKTIDELITQTTVNGECMVINPEKYIGASVRNLKFKCTTCGGIFTQSYSHYSQGDTRCSKCISKTSVGEYAIVKLLDRYDINYIQQQRFADCRDKKTLPFDFYLPDYNCCIEFDGYQHYNVVRNSTEEHLKLVQFHDNIKTDYCKMRGIKLIRIPYWEFKNLETIILNELQVVQLKDIV